MAELHDALKYLGPTPWSSVPTPGQPLEDYLVDLFAHAQVVVDAVPLPSPEDAPLPPKAQSHRATKASEVSLSSERSAPPPFGHEKYQKEWGKPMKMKASENPLGISIYKMSSKDSKGSWFARRSVHEGIGYSKFKRSLQLEFEKSLAEVGPPGTGNVRGIGGEERVEQAKTDLGTVEVYRLSAQFPGPTAARDFVTMLVTSDKAMQVGKANSKGSSDTGPRHYMIISKPCDHPQTQPKSGFVRGYYESIEFIREVPRKLKTSQSAMVGNDNSHGSHHKGHHKADDTETGRKRASTVDAPPASAHPDPSDPEDNPVEWMMITRSDPGGGIPRFLVERGTPGSICADAVKFVDWACQNEDEPEPTTSTTSRPTADRRESHQSWRGRSLVGIEEHAEAQGSGHKEGAELERISEPQTVVEQPPAVERQAETPSQGIFGAAAATLLPYTPQVLLNRLPGGTPNNEVVESQSESTAPLAEAENRTLAPAAEVQPADRDDDATSVKSATSFASAEDHWSSEPEEAESGSSIQSPAQGYGSKEDLAHEAELKRLNTRKEALHQKFAATQSKYEETKAREKEQIQGENTKAQEKHEREMKKHEEKYRKELDKIERKKEKENKKTEAKMKKHIDKDEKSKLTRERDEARQERDLIKKEAESLRHIVADLQKENTALVIKLGKAGMADMDNGVSRSRASTRSEQ